MRALRWDRSELAASASRKAARPSTTRATVNVDPCADQIRASWRDSDDITSHALDGTC